MWQSLAENLFRLYYSLYVMIECLWEMFEEYFYGFRYGLSITFFIIIGDQLDRCM